MTDGKEKLTEKEEETMLLIWEHGPCAVKDLLQYYGEPRPHINTVSTFVRSLEAKGYVGHKPARFGGYHYYALKPKSDYGKSAARRLIDRYFGNSFAMMSQLVKEEAIDAEELRQLLDMVEKRKHD